MSEKKTKILFVCAGNSCRSPMAEAIFRDMVEKSDTQIDWVIDSAGLSNCNVGLTPEKRCVEVLKENGLSSNHIGRQICLNDFYEFDIIFGMDHENIINLCTMLPQDSTASVELLTSYDPENEKIIKDPYYDEGIESFRKCFTIIKRCLENFLAKKIQACN